MSRSLLGTTTQPIMTQDFAALMKEIHKRGGLFSFNPSSERNYDKFEDFQRNILSGLDFNQLNKWLKSHKKDMSCLQKWRTWKVEWTVWITHGPLIQKKQMRERTTYSQACLFSRPFKGPCSPKQHCVLVLLFWNASSVKCTVLVGFHFWRALHDDTKNNSKGDYLFSRLAEA